MILETLISLVLGATVLFDKDGGKEDYAWIYFRCDRSDYEASYLENQEMVASLEAILREAGPERIASVDVVAYASPEGSLTRNMTLSRARAEALRPLVEEHLAEYAPLITVEAGGEAWAPFRERILADSRIADASREKILAIIDDDSVGPDTKEWRLKNRLGADPNVGELYRYILDRHFRYLRCLAVTIHYKDVEAPQPSTAQEDHPEPPVDVSGGDTSSGAPPIKTETDTTSEQAITQVPESPEAPQVPETDQTNPQETDNLSSEALLSEDSVAIRVPLFAVSTNVLHDLAITPNVAVELPLGHHWSVLGEYTFPWWVTPNNRHAWEMLKADLGVRYWLSRRDLSVPMDVLKGHFVGLDFGAGYYDIEPRHTGYQGEFQTVGLEYGYAWELGPKWRLDAFGAIGWMGTHYRYYEGNTDDSRLLYKYNGRYTWFGPTKAGISVKYIFTAKKRRAAK